MANRFSVFAVFKAIDKISAPVSKMQAAVLRFTRRAQRSLRGVQSAMQGIGAGIRRIGFAAVAAGALAAPAFADMVKTGSEFERALVSAGAKFPVMAKQGTEAFAELEKSARDVGRTTEFTATQAARGLGFLAMAGFDAQQSIAVLPGLVDLATAAQLDLARASDIASDVLGAFRLNLDKSGGPLKDTAKLQENLTRVNDVMARTITSSNTDMEQLFETIKAAGPVAADAGVSIENFSAIAGVMANSGVKASRAGTALKNMFVRLQAPPTEARKALKELSIATSDADGNFIGVNATLDQLIKKLPAVGKAQRAQALSSIFGLRALAGANVTLSAGVEFLEEFQKNLEGSTGIAKEMANVIRGDTEGSLASLNSAIESVKISIFKTTQGPLKDLIDRMTVWVRKNEELIAQNIGGFIVSVIENLPAIVDWLKKIGIGLAVFFTFSTIINTLASTFAVLNAVMLLNPITLIVLGVIAAVAAFAALVKWTDGAINMFEKLPGPIRILLAPLEALVRAIKFIKGIDFSNIRGSIGGAFQAAFGFGGGEDSEPPKPAAVVGSQERLLQSFSEAVTTNKSEVTIRDESGRAEVTKDNSGGSLLLQSSGAF